jgi:tetratricopeptide (TPR) repeat protein
MGLALVEQGQIEEAIGHFQNALTMSGGKSFIRSALGHAYAVGGARDLAVQALEELEGESVRQYTPAYDRALIYVGLGDKDRSFEWLERAYEERSSWMSYLNVEPRLDPLRSDSRFSSLLRNVGLE